MKRDLKLDDLKERSEIVPMKLLSVRVPVDLIKRIDRVVDLLNAGKGEVVFWCRGREASFPFLPAQVPSDCTIVGIVDSVFLENQE